MIRILPCLIVLLTSGCASVQETRTLGRYDFSYRIEGDTSAAPLQIFDDGRQTYLQFRDVVPGIFAVNSEGKPVVLVTRREGQHVVTERVEREFVFLRDQDQKRASARYVGKQNRAVLPHELPAPTAPEPPPQIEPLSDKIPFPKGSKRLSEEALRSLERLLPAARAANRVAILERPARERNDRGIGQARALAVRNWLVRHEVDAERILIVKENVVVPDYCEVMLVPRDATKPSEQAAASAAERPMAPAFGAAVPIRVSLPAKPVFADRDHRADRAGVGR